MRELEGNPRRIPYREEGGNMIYHFGGERELELFWQTLQTLVQTIKVDTNF